MSEIIFKSLLTKQDFSEFNRIYGRIIAKKRLRIRLILGIITTIFSLSEFISIIRYIVKYQTFFEQRGYLTILSYQKENLFISFIYAVIAILMFVSYAKGNNRQIKKTMNDPENQLFFSEKEVTVNDEFILIKNMDSLSKFSWSGIKKVIESKKFIAIFTSSSNCLILNKGELQESELIALREKLKTNFNGEIRLVDK
ncbi:YcxB family protein [Carnobacterium gallinarum]|uniref:YcxB family protein n=1 Tax=Carnobacterium gallinarum TaxID=2749 RepID=UPI000555CD75|nr:YcxB family protein [Carnobacterium gallinarum]